MSSWLLSRRSHVGGRGTQVVASLLAVGGLLWAGLGPYMAFPGAKYCYRLQSNIPWEAKIVPIKSGSEVVGHLLYVTDPIRTSDQVRGALKSLGVNVELLENTSERVHQTITMPLSTAIRHTVRGTGEGLFAEELIVPYAGTRLAVGLQKSSCPGENCSVGIHLSVEAGSFALVDYIHSVGEPSDMPWTAVSYPTGRESDAALYGAQLDFSLESFSKGDVERAFGAMESTVSLAPTNLERSRTFALLGQMSAIVLGGNIGETQGLASFDRAMRVWVDTQSGRPLRRTELRSPVERWLFDSFWTVFFNHQAQYPSWRSVLGYDAKPAAKFATLNLPKDAIFFRRFEILPSTQAESLVSAERQHLHEIVQRAEDGGISKALGSYISGQPDVARWVFTTLVSDPENNQEMLTSSRPWRDGLDYAARQCSEPWASRYLDLISAIQRLVNYTTQLPQRTGSQAGEDLAMMFSESGFPLTSRMFSGMAKGPEFLAKTASDSSPAVPWWDRRYRDWYGTTAFTSVLMIESCLEPGPKCRELLEQIAMRCEPDDAGRGNLFAPGLALPLSLSQITNQPISSRWAKAFHDATGMEDVVYPEEQPLPTVRNPNVH